jgi:multidrug efflux pump subunit AcrA (membrane-fusion protein)
MAEVRLPVSTQELAFIDFPEVPHRTLSSSATTAVKLSAQYQGQTYSWMGRIVRSEGVVDQDTGMVMMVAQVTDPFGLHGRNAGSQKNGAEPVLPMGLFVEATIEGRWFDDVIALPESALLREGRIAVIDGDDRLRLREVMLLRRERGRVIIQSGLRPGERVLLSGLHHPVDGIAVTPVEHVP